MFVLVFLWFIPDLLEFVGGCYDLPLVVGRWLNFHATKFQTEL